MVALAYNDFPHPIHTGITDAQRAFWERLGAAGSWWTGQERVAIAAAVRDARAQRSDPPWLRGAAPANDGPLSDLALDTARRIAIDAHRLDRVWCEGVAAELGDAAYVELVSVVVCTTAIDAFAEALGVRLEPLPTPQQGVPDRIRPVGMGDGGAWVAVTEPFAGPNVGRALSLAPGDHMLFMGLVIAMYALGDFAELVWDDRPLSRPQIELVASRVSAVNECFY